MLEIIEYAKDEYAFPSLVVLGCFDAIHSGHRELFKKAKLQAKINGLDLGVMMFRDGKGGKPLYSFEERVEMLKPYNVKFVLAIDYTPEFKQTAPLDFLAAIEEKVNVKAYMSGKDFRFGKGAKGKASTLKNYAEDEENGVWYMPLKDVVCDGEKISTTLIKSCLDSGDVRRAALLLGEEFFVEGSVVEGSHRGAGTLGFPTVNIIYPEWKYPVKHGVYKVSVAVDGATYAGVANFGGRPTFGDDSELLEVHIKDFEGDLYGKNIKVGFVGFMRNIIRFSDAEALAAQLGRDMSALELSDERFFELYPLEEDESAAEQAQTEELAEECAPPSEIFSDGPAEQPEVGYAPQADADAADVAAEEVSEEQIVLPGLTREIIPAWELLSEPAADEVMQVTPSEAIEECAAETTGEQLSVDDVAQHAEQAETTCEGEVSFAEVDEACGEEQALQVAEDDAETVDETVCGDQSSEQTAEEPGCAASDGCGCACEPSDFSEDGIAQQEQSAICGQTEVCSYAVEDQSAGEDIPVRAADEDECPEEPATETDDGGIGECTCDGQAENVNSEAEDGGEDIPVQAPAEDGGEDAPACGAGERQPEEDNEELPDESEDEEISAEEAAEEAESGCVCADAEGEGAEADVPAEEDEIKERDGEND